MEWAKKGISNIAHILKYETVTAACWVADCREWFPSGLSIYFVLFFFFTIHSVPVPIDRSTFLYICSRSAPLYVRCPVPLFSLGRESFQCCNNMYTTQVLVVVVCSFLFRFRLPTYGRGSFIGFAYLYAQTQHTDTHILITIYFFDIKRSTRERESVSLLTLIEQMGSKLFCFYLFRWVLVEFDNHIIFFSHIVAHSCYLEVKLWK